MARRKRGLGLLGWLALIIIVVLVLAYLQKHNINIHLPKLGS